MYMQNPNVMADLSTEQQRAIFVFPNHRGIRLIGDDLGRGGDKWKGGVLAQNSMIYCIPYCARRVLRIDPWRHRTVVVGDNLGDVYGKWSCGILARNGSIYCLPGKARRVLRINPGLEGEEEDTTEFIGDDMGSEYKYHAGVLGEDGMIYGIPVQGFKVLCIHPETGTTTLIGEELGFSRSHFGTMYMWSSVVLGRNSKIYGIPNGANQVLELDPKTQSTTLIGHFVFGPDSGCWYCGGVCAENGKIYCFPYDAPMILEIDPTEKGTRLIGENYGDYGDKWRDGVLARNGKIYSLPNFEDRVLEIDPATNTIKDVESHFHSPPHTDKYRAGILGRDGKIYGIPHEARQVLCIDPCTSVAKCIGVEFEDQDIGWSAGVVADNGMIYAIPSNASHVLEIDSSRWKSIGFLLLLRQMVKFQRAEIRESSRIENENCLVLCRFLFSPDLDNDLFSIIVSYV